MALVDLTETDLIDLRIAVELRVIRYLEEALDSSAPVGEKRVAWGNVRDLLVLLNKLLIGASESPRPIPDMPASLRVGQRPPSPAARRGPSWADSTDQIDPGARQSWRG